MNCMISGKIKQLGRKYTLLRKIKELLPNSCIIRKGKILQKQKQLW